MNKEGETKSVPTWRVDRNSLEIWRSPWAPSCNTSLEVLKNALNGTLEGNHYIPSGLILWNLFHSKGKNKIKIVRIPFLIQDSMHMRIDHIKLVKRMLLKERCSPVGIPVAVVVAAKAAMEW